MRGATGDGGRCLQLLDVHVGIRVNHTPLPYTRLFLLHLILFFLFLFFLLAQPDLELVVVLCVRVVRRLLLDLVQQLLVRRLLHRRLRLVMHASLLLRHLLQTRPVALYLLAPLRQALCCGQRWVGELLKLVRGPQIIQ